MCLKFYNPVIVITKLKKKLKINVKAVKNLKAVFVCNNALEKVQNPPQNVLEFCLMFLVSTWARMHDTSVDIV